MTAAVLDEIRQAAKAGRAWTAYRAFRDADERIGASLCCRVGCRRRSVYVSYCTGLAGRVALCERHAPEGRDE